jgi:hypothetical protein
MTDDAATGKTTLQKCRLWGMAVLYPTIFAMAVILAVRWVSFDQVKDASGPNDVPAAAFYLLIGFVLPAGAFIKINSRIKAFEDAQKVTVNRRLAWISLAFLAIACLAIVVTAGYLNFFATKQITGCVEGHGEIKRIVRYPVIEATQIVCSVFGGLVTFALSLDVFSLSPSKR